MNLLSSNRRNTGIINRNWRLIAILIGISLGVFFLGWLITILFPPIPTLSSRDSAIEQTRELLTIVKDHPNNVQPDSLPSYLSGGRGCWTFFQQQMAQKENQYTITVISEYDSRNSSQPSRDMTEIWLNVNFADGRRAEIYYYQGGISACHEVIDQSIRFEDSDAG